MTLRATALALLVACAPPNAGTTTAATTTTGPATTAATDAPTSSGTTDACDGSSDCDSEGICVAAYTPSDDPEHPGSRGPAACTAKDACIGPLDLERYCFDHQGCCESLRCRTADGVCEPPELGQTGGETTGTTTTGTTGETDTTGADTTTGTSG